jgi:hypothetical protein
MPTRILIGYACVNLIGWMLINARNCGILMFFLQNHIFSLYYVKELKIHRDFFGVKIWKLVFSDYAHFYCLHNTTTLFLAIPLSDNHLAKSFRRTLVSSASLWIRTVVSRSTPRKSFKCSRGKSEVKCRLTSSPSVTTPTMTCCKTVKISPCWSRKNWAFPL